MTEDPLADLRRIMARRRRLVTQLDETDGERDAEIAALLRAKAAPIADLMAASGLKKARLYQIRDGNRGHGSAPTAD